MAPYKSYIDAREFENVSKLAEYLVWISTAMLQNARPFYNKKLLFLLVKWSSFLEWHLKQTYLNGNDTAYAEYFEWKKYFVVSTFSQRVFCQLCQALNDNNLPSKTYSGPTFTVVSKS